MIPSTVRGSQERTVRSAVTPYWQSKPASLLAVHWGALVDDTTVVVGAVVVVVGLVAVVGAALLEVVVLVVVLVVVTMAVLVPGDVLVGNAVVVDVVTGVAAEETSVLVVT